MAILKNPITGNFTLIGNHILRNKNISAKDRGVYCTLCNLPDGWDFSIKGLSTILPDGVTSLRESLRRLEDFGYIRRCFGHGAKGHYTSEIEICIQPNSDDTDRRRKSDTVNPTPLTRHGKSDTVNQTQYNITEYNIENVKNNNGIYRDTPGCQKNPLNDPSVTQTIIDTWNAIPGISNITKISPASSRGKALSDLLTEFDINDIVLAISNIPHSSFLMNGKGTWRINFDWFVKLDNFSKVLENQYADHPAGTTKSSKNMSTEEYLHATAGW